MVEKLILISTLTHLESARRDDDPAGGEPDDAGATGVVYIVASDLEECRISSSNLGIVNPKSSRDIYSLII